MTATPQRALNHAEQQPVPHTARAALGPWLVDHMTEALLVLAPDGRVAVSNPVLERLTGIRRHSLQGQTIRQLHQSYPAVFTPAPWPQLAQRHAWAGESILVSQTGQRRVVAAKVQPFGGDGAFALVMRDITPEVAVRGRAEEAERLECVTHVVAAFGHELNNVLGAVVCSADFVLEDLDSQHPVRDDVRELSTSAQRAASLVGSLVRHVRREVLEPADLDVSEELAAAVPLIRRLVGTDVPVRLTLPASLPQVRFPPGAIAQAVLSLASDVRHECAQGGHFDLNAEADSPTDSTPSAGAARLSIAWQATHAQAPRQTRHRHGLQEALRILNQNGGTVLVNQPSAFGHRLVVTLPATPKESIPPRDPVPSPTQTLVHCTGCGQGFSYDELLRAANPEVLGLQFDTDPELNFFYFTHIGGGCKSTFTVPVMTFEPFITEELPPQVKAFGDGCGGHCADLEDHTVCENDCQWAPFRRLLDRMKAGKAVS